MEKMEIVAQKREKKKENIKIKYLKNDLIPGIAYNKQENIPFYLKKVEFTKKYNLKKLLYYEYGESMIGVIVREKQIKKLLRKEKLQLIESKNPIFADISAEIFEGCDFE